MITKSRRNEVGIKSTGKQEDFTNRNPPILRKSAVGVTKYSMKQKE